MDFYHAVPRRRTQSGRKKSSSVSEAKENAFTLPPAAVTLLISESPATRLSKLTVHADSPVRVLCQSDTSLCCCLKTKFFFGPSAALGSHVRVDVVGRLPPPPLLHELIT